MQPLEIFRAGRHIAADGSVVEFSVADVEASIAAYQPQLHRAPLVVGHPKTDDPAYGWVDRLEFSAPVLLAHPADVAPEFAEAVNAKRYPNKSASFYRPDAPTNPVPGVWYLKHVGFLGAAAPAVKGLKPAQFNADEVGIVTFTDQETTGMADKDTDPRAAEFAEREAALETEKAALKAREDALAAQEAEIRAAAEAARRREIAAFVETHAKSGRILPRQQAGLTAVLASLADTAEVEFAEADKTVKSGAGAWLRKFIEELPVQVEYREIAGAEGGDAGSAVNFAAPAGYAVATDRLDIHHKATAYAAKNKVDYLTAVRAVTAAA